MLLGSHNEDDEEIKGESLMAFAEVKRFKLTERDN